MDARIALAALAVALAGLFVVLGGWQWGRAEEKRAMIATQESALRQPARPLAAALDEEANGPLRVAGAGVFLDRPAVLLDNQVRQGRAGVRVYRVFMPRAARRPLLVELGWLPLPPDRSLPATPRPEGEWDLRGLLASPPAAGLALGEEAPAAIAEQVLVTRVRPQALAAALEVREGLAPRVMRPDPALALGYARDLDPLNHSLPPERHRAYAVQWWALAAVAMVFAVLAARRGRTG